VSKPKTRKRRGGVATRTFDVHDPELPEWVRKGALTAGGFPYDEKLDRDVYEKELRTLQIELGKLQSSTLKTGARIVIVFEGRDSAGKGSCIKRFMEHLNPRHARVVALPAPSDRERGEWYFQRYVRHMPTSGEMVLFDRSWYNRAGVERVMGFCTQDQLADFLREAPQFESLLVRDGIHFFKFYLTIGRETQLKRFHDRRHSPLKDWKFSPMDEASLGKFDAYTEARDEMFRFTHTATCPWTVVRANDKRRARLHTIRQVLTSIEYDGKNEGAIGAIDPLIVQSAPDFMGD
jgi:polyphosphate kinase 2